MWSSLVRNEGSQPQPRLPVLARVPITPCCENQQGLHPSETKGYWSSRCSSLGASAQMCSLTNSLALAPEQGQ